MTREPAGTARPTMAGATIGLLAASAESLRPSLTPRSTLHQGLVTGVMGVTGAGLGALVGRAVGHIPHRQGSGFVIPAIAVGATAGLAILRGRQHLHAQEAAHPEWGPQTGEPAVGAIAGAAAATGVVTGVAIGARELHSAGAAIADRAPGPPVVWTGALALGSAGVTVLACRRLFLRVLGGLKESGRAPDAALREAPLDPNIAGGPDSLVEYDSLTREGRRYVNWRVSADDLRDVGYEPAVEPVRVFVSIETADSVEDRVGLAVDELDRLGAWDRANILAVSPAGSGYANSVPVEALEYFTNGDCASVVISYGVLPSMFSRDLLPMAAQTFRLLIDRIVERIAASPGDRRPKLFLYGESLGAQAAEEALQLEPSLVDVSAASVQGVDAALFVGTPGGPSLRNDTLDNPHTVHVDQWHALPDPLPAGVQLWFLEHDADPVTRFSRDLMIMEPHWLKGDNRGRNVPAEMRWVPLGTWQQVLFDVAYATQAQSGVFRSVGHDYRADLAPLVAAAFAPFARDRVETVQHVLSEREVERDHRLAAAE